LMLRTMLTLSKRFSAQHRRTNLEHVLVPRLLVVGCFVRVPMACVHKHGIQGTWH
jgi:hypothetical protein